MTDDAPRVWTEADASFMAGMLDRTLVELDRLALEEERNMLSNELVHRMKNILTIAQVVVNQTLLLVEGLDADRAAISSRLSAPATAQDILTVFSNRSAGLHDLIERSLKPHLPGEDRLSISGRPVWLTSQQVLGLSLTLHELATNALKYGAWSAPVGRVEISWTVAGDQFAFHWRETGGPAAAQPDDIGFGSTILRSLAGWYFNGTSAMRLDPDGLQFRIDGDVPPLAPARSSV